MACMAVAAVGAGEGRPGPEGNIGVEVLAAWAVVDTCRRVGPEVGVVEAAGTSWAVVRTLAGPQTQGQG